MITAIIQARMGSTRLPGKVLLPILGKPMLLHQLERVRRARSLSQVVVATTVAAADDPIVDLCRREGVPWFRGSEDDVLARYHAAAREYSASIIVRLTADCPLSDPDVIDAVVGSFVDGKYDYTANTVPPETSCFPDGFDVEVFSFAALDRAFREVTDPSFREHVTFEFWRNPDRYRTYQTTLPENLSSFRVTVDYPEDFDVVTELFNVIADRRVSGSVHEIVDILRSRPDLTSKNGKYYFGVGWKK